MPLVTVNNFKAHLQVAHQQVTTRPHRGTWCSSETVFVESATMRVEKKYVFASVCAWWYFWSGRCSVATSRTWKRGRGLQDRWQTLQDLPPGSPSDWACEHPSHPRWTCGFGGVEPPRFWSRSSHCGEARLTLAERAVCFCAFLCRVDTWSPLFQKNSAFQDGDGGTLNHVPPPGMQEPRAATCHVPLKPTRLPTSPAPPPPGKWV